MSISKELKLKWSAFTEDDQNRIVRMAWEDRTSFEAIELQFNLTANEVVRFMRTQLERKAFERWRRRATEQGQLKHAKTRPLSEVRFKCSRQRMDGTTKGWK